jgi:hypothetical protein
MQKNLTDKSSNIRKPWMMIDEIFRHGLSCQNPKYKTKQIRCHKTTITGVLIRRTQNKGRKQMNNIRTLGYYCGRQATADLLLN